jgi:hypothetical protein
MKGVTVEGTLTVNGQQLKDRREMALLSGFVEQVHRS